MHKQTRSQKCDYNILMTTINIVELNQVHDMGYMDNRKLDNTGAVFIKGQILGLIKVTIFVYKN